MTKRLSFILYAGSFSEFNTYWNMRWQALEQEVAKENDDASVENLEQPNDETRQKAVERLVEEFEDFYDCPRRSVAIFSSQLPSV